MGSGNFIQFERNIREEAWPEIARILSAELPAFAEKLHGQRGASQEAHFLTFFFRVAEATGQYAKKDRSDTYLSELVTKSWKRFAAGQKPNSAEMLIAAYHYLHTTPFGKPIAARVDRAIFDGLTYEDHVGGKVPGGYEPEAAPAIRQPPSLEPSDAFTAPHASSSSAERAWVIVERELMISPYEDFAAHHPGTRQAILASEHIRHLELWATIPKADPFAIRQFIRSGPFLALAEHARANLDEAKAEYVEAKVANVVSNMQSPDEPTGALQWAGCLAFPFVAFYFTVRLAVVVWRGAWGAVLHERWPFPEAKRDIVVWLSGLTQGSFGDFVRRFGIPLADAPASDATGVGVQAALLCVLVAAVAALIILMIGRAAYANVVQRQEAQIAEIRSNHLSKVANL